MKVLLLVADGLGNVFQWLPTVSTLERQLGWSIDIATVSMNYPLPQEIFKGRLVQPLDKIAVETYDGSIVDGRAADYLLATGRWHRFLAKTRLLNDHRAQLINALRPFTRSEVDVRLDVARAVGANKFCFDFEITTPPPPKVYDVVCVNGYNSAPTPDLWHLKSYPRMGEVAKALSLLGMSVCSVGEKTQWVPNTDDMTGMSLPDSLAVLRAAKLAVTTDTGLYHAANLLRTPNVAVFTFTSTVKNYDPRFHRYTTLVRSPLECHKICQDKIEWKTCQHHGCRDIDSQAVMAAALTKLKGETT